MKIVCDSCSTKYSISDDKVRGKVFKIRCKKCSHIIVVKGTTEAATSAPEAPTDAVWHLVVDGDQVGPLTDADVRARLSRNEISSENYAWKEGFSDWLRLADVPEFADVAVSPSMPVGGELFSDSGTAAIGEPSGPRATEAGGFFGAGAAGQEAARAGSLSGRTHAPAAAEEDVFSMPATSSAGTDNADLFGAVAPVAARAESGRTRARGSNGTAAGRHDGGRVENLTAQRSENSVLFSLSNLQSLAAPAATAKPSAITATEGSGLIDIRAMAASTLKAPAGGGMPLFGSESRSADDDLPAFGAFSPAAPVLLAFPSSSGPPKWIYILIGLAAVMFIAVGVAAFSILGKPVIVEQPLPPPVAPALAPAAKAGTGTGDEPGGAPSKPVAEGELPPRDGAGSATAAASEKAAEKGASDKASAKGKKGKGNKKGGAGETKSAGGSAVAAAPSASGTPSEPEKAKPAKGSLDDLLEGALNGRKTRPKVEDEPSPGKKTEAGGGGGGGGPLAKAAVVAGMNGVKAKVSACYAQFKVPGLAMVNVVIAKSGKVSGATVTGKFAGTPTGTCVENAVKTGSFPPSEGLSTPYPFTLR